MRIDVDKKDGKVAITIALAKRRFRVRNHTKRHAVGKRKAAFKAHRANKAKRANAIKEKYRTKYLAAVRKYWACETDELRV